MIGSDSSASIGVGGLTSTGGSWLRRRRRRVTNRRVAVQGASPVLVVAEGVTTVGRWVLAGVRVASKVVLLLSVLAALAWGGRLAVRHVVASPRFAVGDIQVVAIPATAQRLPREQILALAEVAEGDRLLEIDTDVVAARVARHPWAAGVRVSRQLPGVLRIEVTERRAAAAATLGALYLVDDSGRPFKRATMDEAEGLPVLTGIERAQYVELREVSEAAFRDALGLLAAYGERAQRPAVSEVNIDPRFGFTLYLLQGGAEIRLGRKDFGKKLARLDQIFEAVKAGETGALVVVHLDHLDGTSASGTRIPVRLAVTTAAAAPAPDGEGKKD